MALLIHFIAQAHVAEMAASGDPNMTVIGVIVGVFLLLLIWLLMPTPREALGEDLKPVGVLPDEAKEEGDKGKDGEEGKSDDEETETSDESDVEGERKPTLAELKISKRDEVSKGKSTDELRQLRKERRAATQTEKAIHDREEAEREQAESETETGASEEKTEESDVRQEQEVTETADESKESEKNEDAGDSVQEEREEADGNAADESASERATTPMDDIITKSDADAGDVYASLFAAPEKDAEKDKGDLKFDELDDVMEGTKRAPQEAVFPMLGSKLIPLNEITTPDKEENDQELLNGLMSKRKAKKEAEKKTLI